MAVQILRICLIKRICSVGDSFRPASRATSLKEGGVWVPRPGALSEGAVSRRLTEGVIPGRLNSHRISLISIACIVIEAD